MPRVARGANVRGRGVAADFVKKINELDPMLTVVDVQTMSNRRSTSTARQRFSMLVLGHSQLEDLEPFTDEQQACFERRNRRGRRSKALRNP